MASSICPFCHLSVSSSQLQRHANSHFEDVDFDEQIAKDHELALQIASSSGSGDGDLHISDQISCLIALQTRGSFYHIKDGLISLLRNCLEQEPLKGSSVTILSSYVDHFQSSASEDVGWGCGWRNIQMLSSHLLACREETRYALFGGCQFVPDIPSLQRWLEIAWGRGFDVHGSSHFNHNIYGSRCWIGTTECAALFRSFGIRARVVDFGPKESQSLYLSVPGSSLWPLVLKRKAVQFFGPMDGYVLKQSHPNDYGGSHGPECSGGSANLANNSSRQNRRHQRLIDWVWNYFSDTGTTVSGSRLVIVSGKSPLYFQHDGHSRTIVGVQLRHQENGTQEFSLLVLDPGHRTAALEKSLRENFGWQKLIKRGVHTLKKPQYQLCWVDPGIAHGDEMEQLKMINSSFIEL